MATEWDDAVDFTCAEGEVSIQRYGNQPWYLVLEYDYKYLAVADAEALIRDLQRGITRLRELNEAD